MQLKQRRTASEEFAVHFCTVTHKDDMDATSIIATVGAVGGGGLLGAIGSIFYFKPRLRVAKAEASQKELEVDQQRQGALEERLAKMERLFLDSTGIQDQLRKEILDLKQKQFELQGENQRIKSENGRIRTQLTKLSKENAALKEYIRKMEKRGNNK